MIFCYFWIYNKITNFKYFTGDCPKKTYFTLAHLMTTDLYFLCPFCTDALDYVLYWSCGEGKTTDLFFFECSSFPLFTPKILVMRVLKRRVEEFLTWGTHTKQRYGEKKGEWIEKKSMYAWVSVFDTPTKLTQHHVEKFVTNFDQILYILQR